MNESLDKLYRSIQANALKGGIPVQGGFELTTRCNFRCGMCYARCLNEKPTASINELTAGQWTDIARQARDAGMLNLILTGGEIFLRKDFKALYTALSELGLIISLYTNGSLITREIADFLSEVPPAKVSVTLYGADEAAYERVTGSGVHYRRVLMGLDYLKEKGIKLELKTTVLRHNFEQFEALSALAEERYGLPLHIVHYISPRRDGCASDYHELRLPPEELALYEKRVMEHNLRFGRERARLEEDDFQHNDPGIASSAAFRCSAGKTAFWISADGRLTPCGLMNEPWSDVVKNGFTSAWRQVQSLCRLVPQCEECSTCGLKKGCLSCPARRMAETGSFTKKVPYLCTLSQMREQLKTAN